MPIWEENDFDFRTRLISIKYEAIDKWMKMKEGVKKNSLIESELKKKKTEQICERIKSREDGSPTGACECFFFILFGNGVWVLKKKGDLHLYVPLSLSRTEFPNFHANYCAPHNNNGLSTFFPAPKMKRYYNIINGRYSFVHQELNIELYLRPFLLYFRVIKILLLLLIISASEFTKFYHVTAEFMLLSHSPSSSLRGKGIPSSPLYIYYNITPLANLIKHTNLLV